MTYPDGDALVPGAFDERTIVLLVRPPDAPLLSEEELDRPRLSTSRTCMTCSAVG